MRNITRYLEDIFTEITLAEEGETENPGRGSSGFADRLESLFTAITFAEAGEFETARQAMGCGPGDSGHGADCCAAGFCTART